MVRGRMNITVATVASSLNSSGSFTEGTAQTITGEMIRVNFEDVNFKEVNFKDVKTKEGK